MHWVSFNTCSLSLIAEAIKNFLKKNLRTNGSLLKYVTYNVRNNIFKIPLLFLMLNFLLRVLSTEYSIFVSNSFKEAFLPKMSRGQSCSA